MSHASRLLILLPVAITMLAAAPLSTTTHLAPSEAMSEMERSEPHYALEVLLIRDDSGRLPKLGTVIERPSLPTFGARIATQMGEIEVTSAIRDRAYIAGWQPIVAEGVVGYQPDVQTVSEGVEFEVHLDESSARRGRATVHIQGALSSVTLRTIESSMTPPTELPVYARLLLNGTMSVPFGAPYVIATVSAAEQGSWYVAVSVTPMNDE